MNKIVRKTQKEQRLDGELGLIIDEMGRAIWNADREYIAHASVYISPPLTIHMTEVLWRFKAFCEDHYGQK